MIKVEREGNTINVSFEGEFDRGMEDELERLVAWGLDGVKTLCFDMEGVEDISSTVLRILAYAQRIMNSQGFMYVEHASPKVETRCKQHDIIIFCKESDGCHL